MTHEATNVSSSTMPRACRGVAMKPHANGERRRGGLSGALELYRLTPAELAKRAGLPSPNLIYNFLKGYSEALSLETVERILTALPSLSFDQLVGWRPYDEIGNLVAEPSPTLSADQLADSEPEAAAIIDKAISVNGHITLKGIAEIPAAWRRPGEPLRLKIALALET